jgi:hypothetical protein
LGRNKIKQLLIHVTLACLDSDECLYTRALSKTQKTLKLSGYKIDGAWIA